jgi:hypothetical protein
MGEFAFQKSKNINIKNMKKILTIALIVSAFGCKKADPFVDRVVAPVLVVFENAGALTSGLTTEPSVSASVASDAAITVRLFELDKKGILDNKMGIDSLPLKALPVQIKLRNGTKVAEGTTDGAGKVVIVTTWKSMGIENPASGNSVLLSCSATYKEVPFTKLFRLAATK